MAGLPQLFGPARSTASEAESANCSKFFLNASASWRALASYALLSAHVLRGFRTPGGTSGQEEGMLSPKMGSDAMGAVARIPSRAARIMARVSPIFIRDPTPYGPPLQ